MNGFHMVRLGQIDEREQICLIFFERERDMEEGFFTRRVFKCISIETDLCDSFFLRDGGGPFLETDVQMQISRNQFFIYL